MEEEPVETQKLPNPIIDRLENNGVLVIRFDKKLRVPEQYKKIEEAEVALRFMTARNETYVTSEGFRDFEIRPALELQI